MRPPAAILAFSLGLATAPAARGEPFAFLSPARGATLRPDDWVAVRWTGTPDRVEELELLLSLDGGRHYSIRLTEELEPDQDSWTWRVPGIPSSAARLAIRMRLDGREVAGAESAVFAIAALPGRVRSWSLQERGGELWLVASDPSAAAAATLPGIGLPRPGWSPLPLTEDADLPDWRSPPGAGRTEAAPVATATDRRAVTATPPTGGRSRRPLDVPLRT